MFSGSAVGGGDGGCSSLSALVPILALACFDGVLAFVAFSQSHYLFEAIDVKLILLFQLVRLLLRKNGIAYPKILFLAAFLLLLSFWVDLCHQANDEEEDGGNDNEENSSQQSLLDSKAKYSPISERRCRCCSFQNIEVGSRQKFVIAVVAVVFVLMLCFAVLIWIGTGKNPIDSLSVAQVYVHFCAVTSLLLGGALGYYGILLFLELRKLRSERSSADMWKVGGLAVVSVLCFTSSALIALLTDSPQLDVSVVSMFIACFGIFGRCNGAIILSVMAVICVFAKAIHWSDLLEEHALYREPAVRHGLDYEHIQHRARSDSCTVASRFRLRYNVDSGCGLC
ncbi:hypothetical protein CDL15_Pgr001398 [Punica granatum]|uniref:Uncharacterized protein n=1 Tax=Punica granatum TaxID=22663 RepID=A0A218WKC6_PUNGR|nr:hypothetical protein CDL15_Pgr001398 [Punica granatum]